MIFVVEGKTVSAAVYYIGETAMLERSSELGGFMSLESKWVDMMSGQIDVFLKSDGGDGASGERMLTPS